MIILKKDETLEDLQINKLRMIQKKQGFRFGEDSVLLANYIAGYHAKTKNASKNIIDLGCNCGSISLILSQKLQKSKITGVEINTKACEVFERNILLNNLSDRLNCINLDWNKLREVSDPGQYDIVVSNPPYKIYQKAVNDEITDLRIAREEIFSDSISLFRSCEYLLKPKGTAFFIYRISRLADIIYNMKLCKIEPRKLKLIIPYNGKKPSAFIIAGQKGLNPGGFMVENPFIIFERPGVYSQEIISMYGKEPSMPMDELYKDIITES